MFKMNNSIYLYNIIKIPKINCSQYLEIYKSTVCNFKPYNHRYVHHYNASYMSYDDDNHSQR